MKLRYITRDIRHREVVIRLLGKKSLKRDYTFYFGVIVRFLEAHGLDRSCSWCYNSGAGGVHSCTITVPEDAQASSGRLGIDVILRWARKRKWAKNVEIRYTTKHIYRVVYDLAR